MGAMNSNFKGNDKFKKEVTNNKTENTSNNIIDAIIDFFGFGSDKPEMPEIIIEPIPKENPKITVEVVKEDNVPSGTTDAMEEEDVPEINVESVEKMNIVEVYEEQEKLDAITDYLNDKQWTGERNRIGLAIYQKVLEHYQNPDFAIAILANALDECSLYPGFVSPYSYFGETVNETNYNSSKFEYVGICQWGGERKDELIRRYKEAYEKDPGFFKDPQKMLDVELQLLFDELDGTVQNETVDYTYIFPNCEGLTAQEMTKYICKNYEVGNLDLRVDYCNDLLKALEGVR